MISLLITLIVIVAIFGIAWWGLSQIPLPAPMRVVLNVVLAILAILVLVSFMPGGPIHLR